MKGNSALRVTMAQQPKEVRLEHWCEFHGDQDSWIYAGNNSEAANVRYSNRSQNVL
jgi:hypothetical protein